MTLSLHPIVYRKCPFCDFINIHEDTITHHIKYTDDDVHTGLNIEKLTYPVVEKQKSSSPWGPYISKDEIKRPWIKCLWCSYKDKIEFDLSLHFLQKNRKQLQAAERENLLRCHM